MAGNLGRNGAIDLGQPRSPSPEAAAAAVANEKDVSAPFSPYPFSPYYRSGGSSPVNSHCGSPVQSDGHAANRSPIYMTYDGDIVGDPGGGCSVRSANTIPPCPPKAGVPPPPPPPIGEPPKSFPHVPFPAFSANNYAPPSPLPAVLLERPPWLRQRAPVPGRPPALPRPPPMQPVAFPPPSLWARPDEEQYPSAALAGLKISPFEEISSASSASYSPVTNPTRHPTSSLSDGDTEKELEQKGCVPYRPAGLLMNAQRLYRPAGRNPLQPNHDTWRTYRPPQYIPSRNRSPQRNYRFICSRSRSRSSSDSNHSTSRRKHSYSRSSRADYDKGRERAYSRERRTTRYSSSHRYRSSSRSSSRDRRSRGHRSYSSDDNRRSSQRSSRRNRSPSRSPSRGVDRDCRSHSRDASPKKSTSYFQRHSSKSSPLKNSEKKAAKLNDAEDDKNLRTAKTERKKSHKHMKASGGDNLANAQRTKPCDIENSLPVKTTSFLCEDETVKRTESGAGNDVSSTTKSTLDCKLPLEVASAIEDLFLPWVQELIADDNMAEDENSSQEAVQELEDFGSIRDSLMDAKENELQETLEELKLWWPIDDVEIIVQQVHG